MSDRTRTPTSSDNERRDDLMDEEENRDKMYHCKYCDYTSNRRSNLERHLSSMHEARLDSSLECCGQSFLNKALLRGHRKSVHEDGYKCLTCDRRFCRKALLKRHMSVHDGHKEFLCKECKYATSHKSNLERHTFRVHGQVEQKQVKRPSAEKKSKSKQKQGRPRGEYGLEEACPRLRLCPQPYKCLNCESAFQCQADYRNHERICHLVNGLEEETVNAAITLTQLRNSSAHFFVSPSIVHSNQFEIEVAQYIEINDNQLIAL